MQELLERLSKRDLITEVNMGKGLRTAAVAGMMGAASLVGLHTKVSEPPEQSVKTSKPISTEVQLNKVTDAPSGSETFIDINKIIHIESTGDSNAVSPKGATGLMQVMSKTWDEMVQKMGKDWDYSEAKDPVKNKAVGTYYMNVEIPRLLKYYKIEDTVENRLAAYNWGIGNLRQSRWQDAPQETIDYIRKYKR